MGKKMKFLSLKSWREDNYISFSELLDTLAHFTEQLNWTVDISDAGCSSHSEKIESFDSHLRIRTIDLVTLITPDIQIVEGDILGYNSLNELVISIRAVDGSWWDVRSNEVDIFNALVDKYVCAIVDEV